MTMLPGNRWPGTILRNEIKGERAHYGNRACRSDCPAVSSIVKYERLETIMARNGSIRYASGEMSCDVQYNRTWRYVEIGQ
jgi:hypothetical protein